MPRKYPPLTESSPDLVAEWHPTKNEPLQPEMVTRGSNRSVWWRCATNPEHEWQTRINNRSKGTGCPICAREQNGRPEPGQSLAELRPDMAAEWDVENNSPLSPNLVRTGSNHKVWWRCQRFPDTPGHHWQSEIRTRALRGAGCPGCAQVYEPEPGKSLADEHPDVSAQWHPERNEPWEPKHFRPGSDFVAWWRCSDCSAEWQKSVVDRARGKGCPGCAGRVPTAGYSLRTEREDRAAQWHPTRNESLRPQDLTHGSNEIVWWHHPACGYEWQSSVHARTRSRGQECPSCSGMHLTHLNNLAVRFPDVAAEWHPKFNEAVTPADVVGRSSRRAWWLCAECGFEWNTAILNRTRRERPTGCPSCAGKTQYLKRHEEAAAAKRRELKAAKRNAHSGS